MFNTKGRKQEERVLNWINEPGITQVQFNKFSVGKAFPSGWYPVNVVVETERVEAAGFKAQENAKNGGKTAEFGFALLNDGQAETLDAFINDIGTVATKILGESSDDNGDGGTPARDAFDAATDKAETLADFIEAVNEHLTGEFVWLAITGREYEKQDGSIGVGLGRRRFGFVASLAEGEGHLKPFDKSNQYDFKRLVASTPESDLVEADSATDGEEAPF